MSKIGGDFLMLVSRSGHAFVFNTSLLPPDKKEQFNFEINYVPVPKEPSTYQGVGGHCLNSLWNNFSWTVRTPDTQKGVNEVSDVAKTYNVPTLLVPESIRKLGPHQIHQIIEALLCRTQPLNDPIQGAINDSIKAGIFPQYIVAKKDGKTGFYTAKELGIDEDPKDSLWIDPKGPEFQTFLKDLFHLFELEYMVN